MLSPPEGCRALLLVGQAGVYEEDMLLSALVARDENTCGVAMETLDFRLVWEPRLQKGDQVAVVFDFLSRTNYRTTTLRKGQVGTILKIHHDPGACRGTSGQERATGDALVSFAGSNHWVSKQDLRKLKRF